MEDSFTHKDCAIFLTMKCGCLCGSLILLSVSLVTFFVWSFSRQCPAAPLRRQGQLGASA